MRDLLPILLLLATLATLSSALEWGYRPANADETELAWTAKQVANGQTPYRDFFVLAPPVAVYGAGGLLRLTNMWTEQRLVPFRILTLFWLVAATLLLHGLLRSAGVPPGWAAGGAVLLPGLLFPFWPEPSFHWFALGFGLAALVAVATPRPAPVAWFTAGFLAACAALVVQTEGAWFVVLIALRLALFPVEWKRTSTLAYASGVIFPVSLCAAGLAIQDALPAAMRATILWPLRFYNQPGGENDALAQEPMLIPGGLIERDVWGLASFFVAAALPVLLIGLLVTSAYVRKRDDGLRASWRLGIIASLVAFILFLLGRADWGHLVFWLVPLLFLALRETDWKATKNVRTRVVQAWLVVALLITGGSWTAHWLEHPPDPERITFADRDFSAASLPTLVSELPGAVTDRLPVLYLDRTASGLYLYHSPASPPVSWVMPPSSPVNSPDQYEALASFARTEAIPWIVIPYASVRSFTEDPSPIRDLLLERYRAEVRTSWGLAFALRTD